MASPSPGRRSAGDPLASVTRQGTSVVRRSSTRHWFSVLGSMLGAYCNRENNMRKIIFATILVLALTACGQAAPSASPPTAGATAALPTEAPAATSAPQPTEAAAATAPPTETPAATSAPEPTAAPVATPGRPLPGTSGASGRPPAPPGAAGQTAP